MKLIQISKAKIVLLLCVSSLITYSQGLSFDKNITVQERQRVAKAVGFDRIRADDRQAGVTTPTQLNIAKVDLNGDNHSDYVVVLDGSLTCGSAGCQTEVFLSRDNTLIRVLKNVNAQAIALDSGTTGGMKNLLLNETSSWVWNGKEYVKK